MGVNSVFFFFFNLYSLKKVRGTQNTETPGSNVLARFDPKPAGVHVEGWVGDPRCLNTGIFCPPSLLETV